MTYAFGVLGTISVPEATRLSTVGIRQRCPANCVPSGNPADRDFGERGAQQRLIPANSIALGQTRGR
jgi:hypothetical protein